MRVSDTNIGLQQSKFHGSGVGEGRARDDMNL
jgi:hypothetical protein